jgi:hypothetical protein
MVDGASLSARLARAHVAHCLRCQAELAQYRRVRRAARSLADEVTPAPKERLEALLLRLEELPVRTTARFRRAAVYAGSAATAAGAVAGALVLTRRARPG